MDYGRFQNIHIRYTKIISVQFRGNIFIVYNLHIEKKWGISLMIFVQIQCTVLSMFCRHFWCSIYKRTAGWWKSWIGVLRRHQDPSPNFFRLPPLRDVSVFASFKKKFRPWCNSPPLNHESWIPVKLVLNTKFVRRSFYSSHTNLFHL
jgi:hypothetical protein